MVPLPEPLSGFKLLRFTAWQLIYGDQNNPATLPRSWAARTTPTTQTQAGRYGQLHASSEPDAVAVEYMVQLANRVRLGFRV